MTPSTALLYVLANLAVFATLASVSGRMGAAAASVGLVNVYVVIARRFFSPAAQLPGEEDLQVLSAVRLSLRRGRPLAQALAAGALVAGSRLEKSLGELVRDVGLGVPMEEAVLRASAAAPGNWSPAMFWALLFGSRTGAPLDGILERLSSGVLQKVDLERQFQVLALNSRLSALGLSALPVGLLALFLPFRPDMLEFVLQSSQGRAILASLLVSWSLGLWIIFQVGSPASRRAGEPLDGLEADLPVFMDLLAEGLDLGLEARGLLERLERTAPAGLLREQLGRVLRQTALGTTLDDALRHEAEASPAPPFRWFAGILADSGIASGTGQVLRLHARELRSRRHYRQAMEVQRAPFVLVLALVFLVFPLTFGLLLLPFAARLTAVLR